MVRVCDDQNLTILQALNTESLESCEFCKKVKTKSSGDIKKLIGCVEH